MKTRQLTLQDFYDIQEAEETLRQIIKGNTAPNGQEAIKALKLLGGVCSRPSPEAA